MIKNRITIIAIIVNLIFLFQLFLVHNVSAETVTFPSKDGLTITADTYIVNKDKTTPFIVLFHQAGWSRGEYNEIAPKLNKLGFNVMAVDQRSGGSVNGVENETAKLAKSQGKSTTYIDAIQDIEASLEYARKNYADGKLIAWGSSYSAALVLKVAGDNPGMVNGVMSFAPGEYFTKLGKSGTWIEESAKNINVPVFITSAKSEKPRWIAIYEAIPTDKKTYFIPETQGNHGSRALWKKFGDSNEYWEAVLAYLDGYSQL